MPQLAAIGSPCGPPSRRSASSRSARRRGARPARRRGAQLRVKPAAVEALAVKVLGQLGQRRVEALARPGPSRC